MQVHESAATIKNFTVSSEVSVTSSLILAPKITNFHLFTKAATSRLLFDEMATIAF